MNDIVEAVEYFTHVPLPAGANLGGITFSGALRGLFTDPTMETSIGGIRYKEPHVYFVNRDQGLFARIQVSAVGEAVAPVETIATGVVGVADLALAPWAEHVAYLVNYEQGQIQKVDENAKVTEAARKTTGCYLDCHLMISEPLRIVDSGPPGTPCRAATTSFA